MAHLHFLGIAGSFMAGLARLAQQKGFSISGSDNYFYPPMGDAVQALNCPLYTGYFDSCSNRPADLYIIGNAISRGNPLLESILHQQRPFISGPQWLYDTILFNKKVIAVAGTHGKTTTTTLLTYLLEQYSQHPSFLMGGIAPNFGVSSRLSDNSDIFVIEADEYDSAYFDKRPKFLHYHPHIAIINNLEFDHADIYADIDAINLQFHYLCRTVADNGTIIAPAGDKNIEAVFSKGHYSPIKWMADTKHWHWQWDASSQTLAIYDNKQLKCSCNPPLLGAANRDNLLAAVIALETLGMDIRQLDTKIANFIPPLRRLQHIFSHQGMRFWDDFAHHPTAMNKTIAALKENQAKNSRVIAVFEPRSNTMKSGYFMNEIADSLAGADVVIATCDNDWIKKALQPCQQPVFIETSVAATIEQIKAQAQTGDDILIMSNGDYGGLLKLLKTEYELL